MMVSLRPIGRPLSEDGVVEWSCKEMIFMNRWRTTKKSVLYRGF